MLRSIISLSIKRKVVVMISIVLLIVAGLYCMVTIPRDAVPDITNNQVQIVTVSPTLAPQEIERLITFPIELSMSNILNVIEIRSISRFGLSVVTVVFDDDVATLDARQLVNEQIQSIADEIPQELGTPQLMPITTGLGEVYQYTLEVEERFKDKYSIMELRTIQDWVVKRNLSGIPGIVEISSFGGELKQYEVAVDPSKLRALNLTINEVFSALEANNQNTGGSYIEKYNSAYYIRSEGMIQSLEDINRIVVTNRNGIPVCIREIGIVRFGAAKRFGAMTKNGEGECVGGIALMLKGANATEVTAKVEERVEAVQRMLPEGVSIKPFLARDSLVTRNMTTVVMNLSEGAVIVFLVLMLFLGNIRVGFVVASIIPLSMLFAFIMMRLFGVSANLMSLGAIDFGIVIDGTIIIVESVMTAIIVKHRGKVLSRSVMEQSVNAGAGSVVKSAFFSVLIILTVFFPILTLTGIEGKTFLPMAQTLIFAIIGALILSVTYIPAMLSLCLNLTVSAKENISDRMMNRLKALYAPLLERGLRHKWGVLAVCLLMLIGTGVLFMRMGGEFMPVLDEGDFAMQMTLPPGSSLSENIELSTRAQKVLMQTFPEIESCVAKIGTAEVPTDPMGVEDADIIITMKPRDEWTSATTRAEIVDRMKESLLVVTGATFNFSQPIQLRFNELMTGSKADIAVKLYGEDMEELYRKANEAAAIIRNVPGAADVIVEQVTGLPQLVIKYNRTAIARYGLDIKTLNTAIRSAYAGEIAGVVYEGERRFDLVVRLNKDVVPDLDMDKIFVKTAEGLQVPISELATIEFSTGPMMITRDATKRRIVVGINVRDADVESVVEIVSRELDARMKLPSGYYFAYGGQFENLKNAKERLSIVIPIALALIITLLFFTFNSAKYALLVFSSVPLSCIGGVLAIYLRDIPFSISAGVGFIALFGVAVLNGIVMLNHYIHLRKEQPKLTVREVIHLGSMDLLRPVLMTGLVASLGFVPMAISNSAGSEMQRPLATVVIGGLIISTLLTLIVIPILYLLANRSALDGQKSTSKSNGTAVTALLILLFVPAFAAAQSSDRLSLSQVVEQAVNNSPRLRNSQLQTEAVRASRSEIMKIGSTEATYSWGQLNSDVRTDYDLSIVQPLGNLLTPYYENRLVNSRLRTSEGMRTLIEREVVAEVSRAYRVAVYCRNVLTNLEEQVMLFNKLQASVTLQYEQGAVSLVDKSLADVRTSEMSNRLLKAQQEYRAAVLRLSYLCNGDTEVEPAEMELSDEELMTPEAERPAGEAYVAHFRHLLGERRAESSVEKSKFFPELSVGFQSQQILPIESKLQAWSIGVSLPIWFFNGASKVKQSKLAVQMAENDLRWEQKNVNNRIDELATQLVSFRSSLLNYKQKALPQSDQLAQSLRLQQEQGDVEVADFIQGLIAVSDTRLGYLDLLLRYHIARIEMQLYQ